MNQHQFFHRKGFTLMELAVVLGIISLIAGAGISMARGALKTADRISTQEKLNVIRAALDSHGKTYGYLPCPAQRALIPTSAAFGVENRNAIPGPSCTAAGGITAASSIYFGAVPVRSLGLPDSYAGDAWGNKFTYAVGQSLVSDPSRYLREGGPISVQFKRTATSGYNISAQRLSNTYTNANNTGSANITFASFPGQNAHVHLNATNSNGYKGSYWVKGNANPTLLTTDAPGSTNYLAYNASDAGGAVTWQSAGNAAAYVVVSHGPDGRGAYPVGSTAIPSKKLCNTSGTPNTSPAPCTNNATLSCLDIENCNDNSTFYDAEYNDGSIPAQYFDDYIVWGSNSIFRSPVNNGLYTSGATTTCPAGVCEPWCAACTLNYPAATFGGTDTTVPPAAFHADRVVLCKKVINSNSTDCKASCFWGGEIASPSTAHQKCP